MVNTVGRKWLNSTSTKTEQTNKGGLQQKYCLRTVTSNIIEGLNLLTLVLLNSDMPCSYKQCKVVSEEEEANWYGSAIMKTPLFEYIENFTAKNWKFSDKNLWCFSYFCLNIDCGFSLERLTEAVLTSTHTLCFWAELRNIMYNPVNPSFTI